MFYIFKNEFKKILWFILGLICGFLINNFDPFSILLDEVSAINSTTWYNTNNMSLYSALIGQGGDIKDNGSNGTDGGVPYIQFSRITATNYDLVIATDNFILDQTYQFNIFSCGMSTLDSNVRTGPSRTDSSAASNVLHYTSGVGTPVSGFSVSPCRIDMYNFKVNKRGNLFRVGISNSNSGSSRFLGFNMGIIPTGSSTGGISQNDLINSQNTIINNINSNNNSNLNTSLNNLQSNINSNNNSNFSNVNSNLNALNSNLTDDIVGPTVGDDLFDDDVYDQHYDLLSIVNIPFDFLTNIVSGSTCSPLILPLNTGGNTTNITIPCMQSVLRTHVDPILTLYQVFISGIIIYGCIMSIIKTIVKSLNPNIMKIDIIDL